VLAYLSSSPLLSVKPLPDSVLEDMSGKGLSDKDDSISWPSSSRVLRRLAFNSIDSNTLELEDGHGKKRSSNSENMMPGFAKMSG